MEIKLNLISPEKKEKLKKTRHLSLILRLEFFFGLALVIFLVVLASFEYVLRLNLSTQLSDYQKGGNFQKIKEVNDFDEKFASANSQIVSLSKIENDQAYWSNIFLKINDIIFPAISVNSLFNEGYSFTILGNASTRDDLILLKEKIEKEDCFFEINLPLSNLVGKNDVEFGISFKVDKECLDKK